MVGVPNEDRSGLANAGLIHVIYATDDWNALGADEQIWHQDVSGVLEVGQAKDRFGRSVR